LSNNYAGLTAVSHRKEEKGETMESKLINIGFGNSVISNRVIAIVSPNSAPMKRLKEDARENKRLIDATQGRRTRSIIITDSNHVILSAVQAETIAQRFSSEVYVKGKGEL